MSRVKCKFVMDNEDEPPEKKVISDGELMIKELARRQQYTKVNLLEQMHNKKEFTSSTEYIPVTNYCLGTTTLEQFRTITNDCDEIEKLKSAGLVQDEINLFLESKKGLNYVKQRHKNLNEQFINKRLYDIKSQIAMPIEKGLSDVKYADRHKIEHSLSIKPNSTETNLLKFALENEHMKNKQLPKLIDNVKSIEKELMKNISGVVDVKAIQKKARNLQRKIQRIESNTKFEAPNDCSKKSMFSAPGSLWDSKILSHSDVSPIAKQSAKTYTCKSANYYTIKNGCIVSLNQKNIKTALVPLPKLSVDEIRSNPKFTNYVTGTPSHILYLKNLASNVKEDEMRHTFRMFTDHITSIKLMNGKMRGQAFITFNNVEMAQEALYSINGTILRKRPIIIQFGKNNKNS